jgi:hypothetical protein
MKRSRAALTHLWPSILVLAIISGFVLLSWYPSAFLQFTESGKFSLLLVCSTALAGPAMTWVVYKKGKWGLHFDLVVIILVQSVAFGWGAYALYQNRPYFMVFTLDRFEVLSKRQVDFSDIGNPQFTDKPFSGPILLYASMPKQGPEFQKLLNEVMFEGKPDLQFRPEFWSLYAEKQKLALAKSSPLLELRQARPGQVAKIDRLVENNGGDIAKLNYVPAMLRDGRFAAILDAHSGEIIDTLVIDPWVN